MRSPRRSSVLLSALLRKTTAAFIVAALIVTAPGLPFYQAFAEGLSISAESADEGNSKPALPGAGLGLAGTQNQPASASLSAGTVQDGFAPLQLPPTTPSAPQAVERPLGSESAPDSAAQLISSALRARASDEKAPEFYRLAAGSERRDSQEARELLNPPSEPGLEAAAQWGNESFSRMFAAAPGEAAAPVVFAASREPAAAAATALRPPAPAVAAFAVAALAFAPSALAATGAASHDGWLAASGSIASVVGNVLAVSYPFFKMAKLYKVRRVSQKKGVSADVLAFGASMLNASIAMEAGLVLSAGAASFFSLAGWGMQNLVGGMALLANAALTRRFQRRAQDAKPSRALRSTLATAAAVAGVSALIYLAGAGWVMPGLASKLDAMTAWATFGEVSRFRLLANIVSVGAFTYLMIPEALHLWRTQDAGEHSKGYYLGALLAKLALGYWSWTMALRLPAADPEHARHVINMCVYPLSAIPAAFALTLARRYSKTKKP